MVKTVEYIDGSKGSSQLETAGLRTQDGGRVRTLRSLIKRGLPEEGLLV